MELVITKEKQPAGYSRFENLYYSEKSVGSALTYGLRQFQTSHKVVKIALGILAYPLLAALALLGIAVNEIHLQLHNYRCKQRLMRAIESSKSCEQINSFFRENYRNLCFDEPMSRHEAKHLVNKMVRIALEEGLFIGGLASRCEKDKVFSACLLYIPSSASSSSG